MELPIIIDEKRAGTLAVQKQGGAVVLTARLRDPGRVVRLTLYGERELYLGVPEPEGGYLTLTKKLTPAEAKRFPQKPEYAAERRVESRKPARAHVIWLGGKPHYF